MTTTEAVASTNLPLPKSVGTVLFLVVMPEEANPVIEKLGLIQLWSGPTYVHQRTYLDGLAVRGFVMLRI